MSRQRNGPGRVTAPRVEEHDDRELPSIRRRRPVMFWAMIVAVLAMVLSLVAVPLAVLFG
ncbi:MAG: hypothetical protein ACRBI6_09865 [Acidimicrobiales bacterium]